MQNSLKRINLILIFWAFALIADAQKKIKHDLSLAILNRSDMMSDGKLYGENNKYRGNNYNFRYLAYYKKIALGIDKTKLSGLFANKSGIKILPRYDYSYVPEKYSYNIKNYTALLGYEIVQKTNFSTILGFGYTFNYKKESSDIYVDDYYITLFEPPFYCEFNTKDHPILWTTIKYKFPKLVYWALNFKYNYLTHDFKTADGYLCTDQKFNSIDKFNFLHTQFLIGISF